MARQETRPAEDPMDAIAPLAWSACGRFAPLAAVLLVFSAVQGCSLQQVYGAGQTWQRQECNKINDNQERNRCLGSASTSYEDYTRQAEDARSGK